MVGQHNPNVGGEPLKPLRIYLLGPPRVEILEGFAVIPRRQARALLYRLAAGVEPIPRERLCFLFWPDEAEATARRYLSHLLTHLQRALIMPDCFVFNGDQIGLNFQQVWSDVVEFEDLCAYLREPDTQYALQSYGTTGFLRDPAALRLRISLYHGSFLEGFSLPGAAEFEEWSTQKRYALERLYLSAVEMLMEDFAEKGELELAIQYAQRYLDTDPLVEDVHRRLIELYAISGNRNAALRQFEICARILEQELGVSPLPETRLIYQDVLERRIFLKRVIKPKWEPISGANVPLIGRAQAMTWLEEAVQDALAGNEKVILISGEAGMGKSRLLQEFIARLSSNIAVIAGGAHVEACTLPYYPIIQALRSLCHPAEEGAPAPLLRWLPPTLDHIWLVEASRVLPELRTLYPNLPLPLPAASEEARSRLFDALVQIVIGLSTSPLFLRSFSSLLLCLEDLHWADSATLEWLVHFGRQIRGSHLVVLGTYRSEEVDALVDLRQGLKSAQVLTELQLQGLDTSSILLLLSFFRGGTLDRQEEFAEQLYASTGGNPFFLLEVLKSMLEKEETMEVCTGEKYIPLPDTVREVIQARIRRLTPVGRQVLEAGAVIGPVFSFDFLRGVAGRREMEVVNGLDELVARQLLMESGVEYRFPHELVARVVEENLSPVRRQILHRRAGWTLARLNPAAVTALARHFDLGGEPRQALSYYEKAVQQAESLFAWKEAEEHQNRMLVLLERLDPHQNQPDAIMQRGLIWLNRAYHDYLKGKIEDRDKDLEVVKTLAEKLQQKTLYLQFLLQQVRYLNLGGHYKKAITLAEEGMQGIPGEELTSLSRFTVALLYVEIAFAHYLLGQPRQGFSALRSAQVAAGESRNPEIQGPIKHHLGYMHLHRGEYLQALTHQQEALRCHQTARDFNGIAWAELDLGFLYLKLGQFLEAKNHLEASLRLAQRISARPAEIYARTYTGYLKLYQGLYMPALECFRETIQLHQTVHQEHGVVAAEIGLGMALYHLGMDSEAGIRFQHAVERAREVSHRRRLVEALVGWGLIELDEFHLQQAAQILDEAVHLARLSECGENLAAGLAALAQAQRRLGDSSAALKTAIEALTNAQRLALPVCEMWAQMEIGLSCLAAGENERALEHSSRAVSLLPQAYEGWIPTEEVYFSHAKILSAMGSPAEAHYFQQQARILIEKKSQHISDPSQKERYLLQKLPFLS
ncbi:ATP-binding protein [Anaerolinea thermophila]|uniref:Bacterial transcriptional activator domain-containing protein n=1 Tax=Anaerolinea thermophila (strain DSM 14523 / JCM 11388 / NBRC 100420 / UNI-1) TaxID=926569 RepID=E8N0F2_ANATU|nr:AAA family ATPase [Anaerolinea thermophila]BAJ64701.1 hypothetical protein ANT_26750 [Anaerolinea thermophila UNI-1]